LEIVDVLSRSAEKKRKERACCGGKKYASSLANVARFSAGVSRITSHVKSYCIKS
jgi:hypothetical protein